MVELVAKLFLCLKCCLVWETMYLEPWVYPPHLNHKRMTVKPNLVVHLLPGCLFAFSFTFRLWPWWGTGFYVITWWSCMYNSLKKLSCYVPKVNMRWLLILQNTSYTITRWTDYIGWLESGWLKLDLASKKYISLPLVCLVKTLICITVSWYVSFTFAMMHLKDNFGAVP